MGPRSESHEQAWVPFWPPVIGYLAFLGAHDIREIPQLMLYHFCNRRKLELRFSKLGAQIKFGQVVAIVRFLYAKQAIAFRIGTLKRARKLSIACSRRQKKPFLRRKRTSF